MIHSSYQNTTRTNMPVVAGAIPLMGSPRQPLRLNFNQRLNHGSEIERRSKPEQKLNWRSANEVRQPPKQSNYAPNPASPLDYRKPVLKSRTDAKTAIQNRRRTLSETRARDEQKAVEYAQLISSNKDRYVLAKSYGLDTCCVNTFPLLETVASGGFKTNNDKMTIPSSGFYYISWETYVSRAEGDCVLTLSLPELDVELARLHGVGHQSGSRVVWLDKDSEVSVSAFDAYGATAIDGMDILIIHMG